MVRLSMRRGHLAFCLVSLNRARSPPPVKRHNNFMRILQILHDRERGGVETLAHTIERGLEPHGIVFETAYLFGQPGLGILRKLSGATAMARRILRGGFD